MWHMHILFPGNTCTVLIVYVCVFFIQKAVDYKYFYIFAQCYHEQRFVEQINAVPPGIYF